MKTKAFLIIAPLVLLSAQIGYCATANLYVYSTENEAKVLLKLQPQNTEWIQLVLTEDTLKEGNITKKIYRPTAPPGDWEEWKYTFFLKLATSVNGQNDVSSKSTPNKDYTAFYRFVHYLKDQIKSGYSAVVKIAGLPFDVIVYDVNKMLVSPPSDDSIRRLGCFGYGITNIVDVELIKKAEEGSVSVILDPPFKEPYAVSMRQFASKIQKPKEKSPYLLIILPGLVIIMGLLSFSFYMMSKIKKIQQDRNKLASNISEMERQAESKDKELSNQGNDRLIERDKYVLETALGAMREVQQLLTEQTAAMQADLPVYKIHSLIESIGAKLNGKWVDASKRRLSEIIRDILGVDNSVVEFPIPENIDEFGQIKWSEKFTPAINKLAALAESRNLSEQASKQVFEAIGRDVIATVVDAIDKSAKNLDSSVENDLKRLLAMTGIKEMEVKPGQSYNPDLHELVISSDPSLVTDREQKITRIISRGLILPSGKVIKAKVSIQRKV